MVDSNIRREITPCQNSFMLHSHKIAHVDLEWGI